MQRILSAQFNFWLVISTCIMHVFCCGLPLALSIGSIAAVLGLSGGEWVHPAWLSQYEMGLMAASGAVLAFTGMIQFISYRIDCRKDGDCHHEPCDSKKTLAHRVYFAALALFALNVAVTLLTH